VRLCIQAAAAAGSVKGCGKFASGRTHPRSSAAPRPRRAAPGARTPFRGPALLVLYFRGTSQGNFRAGGALPQDQPPRLRAVESRSSRQHHKITGNNLINSSLSVALSDSPPPPALAVSPCPPVSRGFKASDAMTWAAPRLSNGRLSFSVGDLNSLVYCAGAVQQAEGLSRRVKSLPDRRRKHGAFLVHVLSSKASPMGRMRSCARPIRFFPSCLR